MQWDEEAAPWCDPRDGRARVWLRGRRVSFHTLRPPPAHSVAGGRNLLKTPQSRCHLAPTQVTDGGWGC